MGGGHFRCVLAGHKTTKAEISDAVLKMTRNTKLQVDSRARDWEFKQRVAKRKFRNFYWRNWGLGEVQMDKFFLVEKKFGGIFKNLIFWIVN